MKEKANAIPHLYSTTSWPSLTLSTPGEFRQCVSHSCAFWLFVFNYSGMGGESVSRKDLSILRQTPSHTRLHCCLSSVILRNSNFVEMKQSCAGWRSLSMLRDLFFSFSARTYSLSSTSLFYLLQKATSWFRFIFRPHKAEIQTTQLICLIP